jgi:inner membrane protein
VGAVMGHALAKNKIGKHAWVLGALANSLPDIDALGDLYYTGPDAFLFHRGITHSILFLMIAPVFFGWLCNKIRTYSTFGFKFWYAFWWLGIFLHLLLDLCTSYGTGLLSPFSQQRFSFNLLFVADPFFTIPILLASIFLLFGKFRTNVYIKKITLYAGLWVALYGMWAMFNKKVVADRFTALLSQSNITAQRYFTTPTPLNTVLWYCVAERNHEYFIAHLGVLDTKEEKLTRFYKLPPAIPTNEDELKKLKIFSSNYYTTDTINGLVHYYDIRFGQFGGWEFPDTNFVFEYVLNDHSNQNMAIQKGRFKGDMKQALASLWKRMKGN